MIPEIHVFDKNLEFVGIIDEFISLRWRRKYFEAGEFELHIVFETNIKRFIKEDYILIREDATESGIIESFQYIDQENFTEVIIFGRFLSSILDRRIVKKRIDFNGKILDGERKILSEMTPFQKLEISGSTIDSDIIRFQCTYKCIYDYLNKLSRTSTVAHRIIADLENKKYIYENYNGRNLTGDQKENIRFEFSEDKENINQATYTFSSKTKKNYALVGGVGEGTDRILVEINKDIYSDFDLREKFVDARGESKENISSSDYSDLLRNKGTENLMEETETFEIKVNTDGYKKYWDLGDIVDVKKESWEKFLKKRIVEIEEVFENSVHTLSAVFGNPIKETFKDDDNS